MLLNFKGFTLSPETRTPLHAKLLTPTKPLNLRTKLLNPKNLETLHSTECRATGLKLPKPEGPTGDLTSELPVFRVSSLATTRAQTILSCRLWGLTLGFQVSGFRV